MALIAGGALTARSLRGECVKSTLTEPPLSGREKMLSRSWITKRGVAAGSPSRNYGEAHSVVGRPVTP